MKLFWLNLNLYSIAMNITLHYNNFISANDRDHWIAGLRLIVDSSSIGQQSVMFII